ncbi:MAG: IS110 family transposase [Candidatus Portnoybacteria bacterium]|nr:IS110 family transposase [Candidatus Portnoybacteria bacterium]
MQTINRSQTLFVGVDVHKDTHTAVGLSPFGEKIFEMTIGNEAEDFISLIEKTKVEAEKSGLVPSFGLEDVHSWGERLSSFLVEEGLPVMAVAPILVDHLRSKTTHPEKSDSLDAHGVAEVMIQKIDTLPVYKLTEEGKYAKQIRELSLEREGLVRERARLKNQLHILLHRIHNTSYRTKFKDSFSKKALRYWMRSAPKDTEAILERRMKRAVRRLLDLREEIQEIEEELTASMKESEQTLATASGCGTVIAAELIGEIGDISRFHSPGALAKYAGCAPRQHSSGKTIRWRKTRSGNRRLNRSFHRMALSQISRSGNDAAREYFKRKVSEGKTKAQALVCLRRQLVNVVWMMMKHKTEYRYPQEKLA